MKVYFRVSAEGSCGEDGRPCIWFPNQCSCFEQKTSGLFFVACAVAGGLEETKRNHRLAGYAEGYDRGYSKGLECGRNPSR